MITLANGPTGKTLYVVYNDNTGLMFRTDNTFEALSGANWLQYAFALTESVATNQRYSRTTPAALLAGVAPYSVDVRLQAGTSPAITDPSLTIFTLVDQLIALPFIGPGLAGGLDLPILEAGTMQAGSTSTTAVLRAGASAVNKAYDNMVIQIVGGTGAGQRKPIALYNGTTKTATIRGSWATTPDNTSVYLIRAEDVPILDQSGDIALAGSTATTLNLNTSANNTTTDFYKGAIVKIIAGTGANQSARTIIAYNFTTQVATVDQAWAVTPDATSVYRIAFEHIALDAASLVAIATALLTAAISPTARPTIGTVAEALAAARAVAIGNATRTGNVEIIHASDDTTPFSTITFDSITSPTEKTRS